MHTPAHRLLAAAAAMLAPISLGAALNPDSVSARPGARASLADHALRMLQEGNERFVAGRSTHPNTDVFRIADTGENGQHPFAAIVTCADSRLAVERLFDRGVGDLFVVRVAGNICDPNQSGSIEYACEHLGARLVVVLGHTHCGAVKAAIAGAQAGPNLGSLLDNIAPAVQSVRAANPALAGDDLVHACIHENVWRSIADLYTGSQVMRELVSRGSVRVIGAVYDVETGRVDWLGQHPMQAALLRAVEPATSAPAPASEKPAPPAAADKPRADRTPTGPAPDRAGSVKPGAVPASSAKKPDAHGDDRHTPAAHPH